MKISIITAAYNSCTTLQKCLNSVHFQTYAEKEHIIIDGGSTDRTRDIIIRNQEKISVFVSEKDSGIYDALNKGISKATGDIIGFLHSDDFFADENVLSRVADTFEKQKTDSVYGDLVYIKRDDPEKIFRFWKAGEFHQEKILKGWMPPHPSLFIKKDIYEKYECFDTSYRIASDYDLILRFLYQHKITASYIPDVLVKMRTGGKSNKNLKNIIRKSKEDYRALKSNGIRQPFLSLIAKNFRKLHQLFR